MYEDFVKVREGFVLVFDLYFFYEVIFIYVDIEFDWGVYYSWFMEFLYID